MGKYEDKLFEKLFEARPKCFEHLGDNAFKYEGLYIELRPETIFNDTDDIEMDFAIFETEEDMNTDYELHLRTDYFSIVSPIDFWCYVANVCHSVKLDLIKDHIITNKEGIVVSDSFYDGFTYAKIFVDFFVDKLGAENRFMSKYKEELKGKTHTQKGMIDYLEGWNYHTFANSFEEIFKSLD